MCKNVALIIFVFEIFLLAFNLKKNYAERFGVRSEMLPLTKTGLIDGCRLEDGHDFAPLKQDLTALKNSLEGQRVFSLYERIDR